MEFDLYAVLCINREADADEIKRAYRRLALSFHPDKCGSSESFQKIAKAYEILSDQNLRHLYDLTESVEAVEAIDQQSLELFPGLPRSSRMEFMEALFIKPARAKSRLHEMPLDELEEAIKQGMVRESKWTKWIRLTFILVYLYIIA